MNCALMLQPIFLERCYLFSQFRQTLGALLRELSIMPMLPAFENVGNVVLRHPLALVIEREAVMFHVIEPDAISCATFRKDHYGRGDARIRFENSARH